MKGITMATFLVLVSSAAVAQTVDQVSVVSGSTVFNVGSAAAIAQSFTVGLDGLMVQAEVEISNFDESPTEDMTFSIVLAPGGVPSTAPGDELFSTTVLAADVTASRTSVLIDISIPVAVGDQLALVMDAPVDPDTGFNTWSLYAQSGDPYAAGDAYRFGGAIQDGDVGFRTFVDETIVCGNGMQDAGEDCDDGNNSNTDDCLNDCSAPSCGDGFIQAGVEACDDGNAVNGDGCEDDCTATPVPTTGEWGLIFLSLLLLGAGAVVLRRRESSF